jgi:hypothetical protein
MEWFNDYEIRARIAPTIIILLPIIIMFFSIFQIPESIITAIVSFGLFFIVIFALSFIPRELGIKMQQELWKKWGGPPSTLIIRCKDPHLSLELKKQLYKKIEKKYGIELPHQNDQITDPNNFSRIMSAVFNRVRADLHEKSQDERWKKQNAEYGFLRNLAGSRLLWCVISLIGIFGCFIGWIFYTNDFILIGFALNFIICICSIIFGWFKSEKAIEDAGFRYAEFAWNAFLTLP